MRMNNEVLWMVDTLTEITSLQSEIIDELFILLARYMSDKEIGQIPTLAKMTEVQELLEKARGIKLWQSK